MDLTARPAISAVLPAFNEAANLERTVGEVTAALRRHAPAYEVIVVDDGSVDETPEVGGRLSRQDPRVRVLRHAVNRGYGAALRTGFAAAAHEWILLLDADGQFDPDELPRFLAHTAEADLIVGYRVRRADRPHRRLYGHLWRALMRVALGLRVRDVDCAFKLMRTRVIQSLPLESRGAFISAECLARAQRKGARIVEVPVSHRPRRHGASTGGRWRVLVRAFWELGRWGWRIRWSRTGATGPPAATEGSGPPRRSGDASPSR